MVPLAKAAPGRRRQSPPKDTQQSATVVLEPPHPAGIPENLSESTLWTTPKFHEPASTKSTLYQTEISKFDQFLQKSGELGLGVFDSV